MTDIYSRKALAQLKAKKKATAAKAEKYAKENAAAALDLQRLEELQEMAKLLEKKGFDGKHAKRLRDEGMGPYELEHILKFQPGSVGSLRYTHGIKKRDEQ